MCPPRNVAPSVSIALSVMTGGGAVVGSDMGGVKALILWDVPQLVRAVGGSERASSGITRRDQGIGIHCSGVINIGL